MDVNYEDVLLFNMDPATVRQLRKQFPRWEEYLPWDSKGKMKYGQHKGSPIYGEGAVPPSYLYFLLSTTLLTADAINSVMHHMDYLEEENSNEKGA